MKDPKPTCTWGGIEFRPATAAEKPHATRFAIATHRILSGRLTTAHLMVEVRRNGVARLIFMPKRTGEWPRIFEALLSALEDARKDMPHHGAKVRVRPMERRSATPPATFAKDRAFAIQL